MKALIDKKTKLVIDVVDKEYPVVKDFYWITVPEEEREDVVIGSLYIESLKIFVHPKDQTRSHNKLFNKDENKDEQTKEDNLQDLEEKLAKTINDKERKQEDIQTPFNIIQETTITNFKKFTEVLIEDLLLKNNISNYNELSLYNNILLNVQAVPSMYSNTRILGVNLGKSKEKILKESKKLLKRISELQRNIVEIINIRDQTVKQLEECSTREEITKVIIAARNKLKNYIQ